MTINSVSVIGVGVMGSLLARHLLKGGYRVSVYDVKPQPVEALVREGAYAASSPGEAAAESELTLLVVLDDAQVKEACLASGGVLEKAASNAIVAICSTVQPHTCREIAEKARARNIHVLDTPMIRGVQAAAEGNLLLMAGGDPTALERCKPALHTFASDIHHLGDSGSGQVGKMVNNLILWTCVLVDREGMTLAKSHGVNPSLLREAVIRSSSDNWSLREWEQLCNQPKWWHQKDLDGVLCLAEKSETPMPISALVKELIKGFGPEDAAKLFKM